MNKLHIYTDPEMEVTMFTTRDVITTSSNYDTPVNPSLPEESEIVVPPERT